MLSRWCWSEPFHFRWWTLWACITCSQELPTYNEVFEQNHIQMLCVCLCLLRRRCSRLRVLFTTRNVMLSFSSGQNFGPLLLKLAICTCGWNLNIMEVKWKAGIFLLGVILLLIWNLLSSTTSCSLYMCQISDSVVSVLVFEFFMCVANHTKCY